MVEWLGRKVDVLLYSRCVWMRLLMDGCMSVCMVETVDGRLNGWLGG